MSTIEQSSINVIPANIRGEVRLWQSVILQALWDATSNAHLTKEYHTTEFDYSNSIAWLKGFSRDFIDVCHNAGFDPRYVREEAKEVLTSEGIL